MRMIAPFVLKVLTNYMLTFNYMIILSCQSQSDFFILTAEYVEDNPKILTKCDHHFHLACILEWMERSDICPVCDKVGIVVHIVMLKDLLLFNRITFATLKVLNICFSGCRKWL